MYQTLAERKRVRLRSKALAAKAITGALSTYARDRGGRFLLYGSVASGRLRVDSDIDILVDFPDAMEGEAWRFAEELCWRHGIKPDIKPLRWCAPAFRDKVTTNTRVLE